MYSVYINNGSGNQLLYSPTEINDGYAILYPKYTQEINRAASFSFILPPTNPRKNDIYVYKTVFLVYEDSTLIFKGRCRETKRTFNNMREYDCEETLAYLNDVDLPPYNTAETNKEVKTLTGWMTYLIGQYNAKAHSSRQFYAGTGYDSMSFCLFSDSTSTVIDELMRICDYIPTGAFRTRYSGNKTYIDFYETGAHYDEVTGAGVPQTIEFAQNLINFDEYIDATEIVTRIKAYGKTTTKNKQTHTIQYPASGSSPGYIVDSNRESELQTAVYRELTWSEIENVEDLQEMAEAYLANSVLMATTIELTAVDLHLLNASVDKFKLGCAYRMISAPHGIDSYYTCRRIEVDMADPRKNTYEFGAVYKTRKPLTETVAFKPPVL